MECELGIFRPSPEGIELFSARERAYFWIGPGFHGLGKLLHSIDSALDTAQCHTARVEGLQSTCYL